jgi:hypothetical protein
MIFVETLPLFAGKEAARNVLMYVRTAGAGTAKVLAKSDSLLE